MIKKSIQQLKKNGYFTISNLISKSECRKIKKELIKLNNKLKKNKYFLNEGSRYGQDIIRDLPLREPNVFLKYTSLNKIIKTIENVFNDKAILDNMMGSNSVNVKGNYNRHIHIDSQMPINNFHLTTDVIVMICIDEFKIENGATKIWPGSHKSGKRIHHLKKNKNINNKFKYLIVPSGGAAIILGQTWHQVGKNISGKSRWSIFLHYTRWWIKPSTNFTKCGNKIFKMLTPKQKHLFGFTSISPSYDFVKNTKKIYMNRNLKEVPKNYYKALNY